MNHESPTIGELREIIASVRCYLERELELGIETIPFGEQRSAPQETVQAIIPEFADARMAMDMETLRKDALACERCPLQATRQNVVFGIGNEQADLVFVGEAPGANEDRMGEPFVGRAGQLLTNIIRAIKLKREDVYILNVLKCRPPANRNPQPPEIEQCAPFLQRQLELIQPKVICTLGKFAAQALLNTAEPISRLRGHFHTYHGIPLMPTYHPAFLLRNPDAKRDVWEDVQKVQARLNAQ